MTIESAIAYMKAKHSGQEDKAGEEYWKHPLGVMNLCKNFTPRFCDHNVLYCALLHDVMEDTDTDEEEIRKVFGEDLLASLRLLTHKKGMPFLTYVQRVAESGNRNALVVKWCDLMHNSSPRRLAKLDAGTARRLEEKYAPAIKILLHYEPWMKNVALD